jgi:hypothetical protein
VRRLVTVTFERGADRMEGVGVKLEHDALAPPERVDLPALRADGLIDDLAGSSPARRR